MGPDTPRAVSPRAVWIVLINASALALGLALLWHLRTIVSWVLVALLIALALQPAVAWLTRHRIRRGWAVATVFIVVMGLVVAMVATLVPMVTEQARELAARAPELIERVEESRLVGWADRQFRVLDRVQAAIGELLGDVAQPALAVAKGVLGGLAGVVTVVVLAVFMLLFGDEVIAKSLQWVAPDRRENYVRLLRRMRRVVGGYVAGTLVVAGIGGVVMGTTLALLGVPYFLPLGLTMMVLGIIPFLGSALGAVLLVGMAFASSGLYPGLITAVVYLVYQQVENELLQPLVQRRTLRMNPLIITLALLAGTGLAGVLGALLALPIAGAIQVLLQDALERRQARWGGTAGPT
jgi:predicted PurR-regulated permease PerM